MGIIIWKQDLLCLSSSNLFSYSRDLGHRLGQENKSCVYLQSLGGSITTRRAVYFSHYPTWMVPAPGARTVPRQDRLPSVLGGGCAACPWCLMPGGVSCMQGCVFCRWVNRVGAHVLLYSISAWSTWYWAGICFFYTLNIKLKPKPSDLAGQGSIPLVW